MLLYCVNDSLIYMYIGMVKAMVNRLESTGKGLKEMIIQDRLEKGGRGAKHKGETV